jgi:CelD/BcsL family acetyltransferase involved in cellulose biosynthesis
MNGFSTRVLKTWEEVEGIYAHWSALLASSRANAIFLTPEWVAAWRGAMRGIDIAPRVIVVEHPQDGIVGVAPFYLGRAHLLDRVPYRFLRVMGDYASGSVYSDIIAATSHQKAVETQVFDAVQRIACDGVWMPHVRPWTGAAQALRDAATAAGMHVEERLTEFYVFDLPDTLEAYEARLSKSTRKDFRRARRKLIEDGSAEVRTCARPEDVQCMLGDLFHLSALRWEGSDEIGVFQRKPQEAEFYRLFAPQAQRRGWLRLLTLNVDGRAVAAEYGYRYGGSYVALQAGYDVSGPPGSGKVLLNQMISQEIDAGTAVFDLLVGDASYKSSYGAEERHCRELFMLKKNINTLPLRLGHVWPRGRYLAMTHPETNGGTPPAG